MEAPALCPERVTVRTKEGVGLSLQIDIICLIPWWMGCSRLLHSKFWTENKFEKFEASSWALALFES